MFVLLSTDKKAKTVSLKVFKIMNFKNLQQETTKGTLGQYPRDDTQIEILYMLS